MESSAQQDVDRRRVVERLQEGAETLVKPSACLGCLGRPREIAAGERRAKGLAGLCVVSRIGVSQMRKGRAINRHRELGHWGEKKGDEGGNCNPIRIGL